MVAAGRKSGSVLYAGALALLASVPGAAEEIAPTLRSGAYAWGLGAGVVANDRGYRGEGIDVVPIPVLYFETQRFRFLGTQAEYELFGDGPFALDALLEYRFDGFEPDDEPVFAGMDERDGSLHAGFRAAYDFGALRLVGEAAHDVLDEHGGYHASLGVMRAYELGTFIVMPKAAVEFFSDDYVDYYYGVRQNEVRLGRPLYVGDSTVSYDVGVDVQRVFAKRHVVFVSAKYRFFGTEIENSPLVEESGAPQAVAAYVYRF